MWVIDRHFDDDNRWFDKKPCDDDVNLGTTGAKDAPSLLHCDPAEAETKFEFISFFLKIDKYLTFLLKNTYLAPFTFIISSPIKNRPSLFKKQIV